MKVKFVKFFRFCNKRSYRCAGALSLSAELGAEIKGKNGRSVLDKAETIMMSQWPK
jgi:hypothetical protein